MGSESAHCLRFSEKEKRYKGYTMSSPILDYEMRFQFGVPSEFGHMVEQISLHGGESNSRSDYGRVTLLGEL